MNNNIRKIILGSIIGVLVGTLMSVSYAFFTYANTGTNNQLITGNIWMRYRETNTLTLENAMPSTTYDANNKFQFSIDGTNTTTDKDVWYEIKIKRGDIPTSNPAKTESDRIPDRYIKYKLVKEVNNVETVVVDGDSWEELNTGKVIYVDKIAKDQSNQVHNYTMYMWISDKLEIGTSQTANFTIANWNKAFASIKVDVNGDFTKKVKDEPYMTVNAMRTVYSGEIVNQKNNIKEVYFNKMSEAQMNTRFNAAPIKADLTYNNEGKVLAWLEEIPKKNEEDPTQYIMYVASDGKTYLDGMIPGLFQNWKGLEKIEFNNINTSRVTFMSSLFAGCEKLKELDLSNWNTDNVTSMGGMTSVFANCSSLEEINLVNFNFNSPTINALFSGDESLRKIYVSSSFEYSSASNSSGMFSGCTSLVGQAPNKTYPFDDTKVDKTMAVIATDTTPGYLTDIALKPAN